MSVSSPEKAGVGGSIPSLATIFNNLQAIVFNFGCNWLHFRRLSYPKIKALLDCVRRFNKSGEPLDGPPLRRWNELLVDILGRAGAAVT